MKIHIELDTSLPLDATVLSAISEAINGLTSDDSAEPRPDAAPAPKPARIPRGRRKKEPVAPGVEPAAAPAPAAPPPAEKPTGPTFEQLTREVELTLQSIGVTGVREVFKKFKAGRLIEIPKDRWTEVAADLIAARKLTSPEAS